MPQFPTPVDHSLDAVDPKSPIRVVYPKDFYPNPQTVHFPLGKTTYWILGPEDGTKVVLVHGISTPSLIWRNVGPYLAKNGFRVLLYDLYGRGYSEAPDTPYNPDLYATQLALLLQYVRWDSAHIVGLSMGGGVTAAFAATFPHLVTEKVIFLASAGVIQGVPSEPPPPPEIEPELASDSSNTLKVMPKLQREVLPGYHRAFASSFRHGILGDMENAFKMIADTPRIKSCIIHGTGDRTVSVKAGERIKGILTSAEWVPIEGADHDLIVAPAYFEQARSEILKFLKT
ncbi:hypothetical protein M422DRAFT_64720 [Sphaerobolus stellatus SS14]|nr:hypothetical protein M422DRAFT_64720 [Sphaerobolus stellatus SS14]